MPPGSPRRGSEAAGAQLVIWGQGTPPLTWGSTGAPLRSRGSGRWAPSGTATVGGRGGPRAQRVGDRVSPAGPGLRRPGRLHTAGGSSGPGCGRGDDCPSVPLSSSSWPSPGSPPATWCRSGRTPGSSGTGPRKVSAKPRTNSCRVSGPLPPLSAPATRTQTARSPRGEGRAWVPEKRVRCGEPAQGHPGHRCGGQQPNQRLVESTLISGHGKTLAPPGRPPGTCLGSH